MTATERLRALLDERGVEWWPSDDPRFEDIITLWRVGPFQWTAIESEKDLWLNAGIAGHEPLAPEQAVVATVGVGTCRLIDNDSGPDMHCTACGGGVDDEYRYFMDSWGYSRCPHCGARIEVSE